MTVNRIFFELAGRKFYEHCRVKSTDTHPERISVFCAAFGGARGAVYASWLRRLDLSVVGKELFSWDAVAELITRAQELRELGLTWQMDTNNQFISVLDAAAKLPNLKAFRLHCTPRRKRTGEPSFLRLAEPTFRPSSVTFSLLAASLAQMGHLEAFSLFVARHADGTNFVEGLLLSNAFAEVLPRGLKAIEIGGTVTPKFLDALNELQLESVWFREVDWNPESASRSLPKSLRHLTCEDHWPDQAPDFSWTLFSEVTLLQSFRLNSEDEYAEPELFENLGRFIRRNAGLTHLSLDFDFYLENAQLGPLGPDRFSPQLISLTLAQANGGDIDDLLKMTRSPAAFPTLQELHISTLEWAPGLEACELISMFVNLMSLEIRVGRGYELDFKLIADWLLSFGSFVSLLSGMTRNCPLVWKSSSRRSPRDAALSRLRNRNFGPRDTSWMISNAFNLF